MCRPPSRSLPLAIISMAKANVLISEHSLTRAFHTFCDPDREWDRLQPIHTASLLEPQPLFSRLGQPSIRSAVATSTGIVRVVPRAVLLMGTQRTSMISHGHHYEVGRQQCNIGNTKYCLGNNTISAFGLQGIRQSSVALPTEWSPAGHHAGFTLTSCSLGRCLVVIWGGAYGLFP